MHHPRYRPYGGARDSSGRCRSLHDAARAFLMVQERPSLSRTGTDESQERRGKLGAAVDCFSWLRHEKARGGVGTYGSMARAPWMRVRIDTRRRGWYWSLSRRW